MKKRNYFRCMSNKNILFIENYIKFFTLNNIWPGFGSLPGVCVPWSVWELAKRKRIMLQHRLKLVLSGRL